MTLSNNRLFRIFYIFITLVIGILIVAVTTQSSSAAQFRTGGRSTIGASETINDDIYISGGDNTIDGTINGDVFVAGGTVRVNGTVNGDLFIAGGTISINGTVSDDARISGGQITIQGKIGSDLLVYGGDIAIEKEATVAGTTKAAAGQMRVAGTLRDLDAAVGALTIASTSTIAGNLKYMSNREASIATDSKISGDVTKIQPRTSQQDYKTQRLILSTIASIAAASLLIWLFPNKIAQIGHDTRENFGPNLVWGLGTLFGLPLIISIFLITVVGIPIGLILLFLFSVILLFGKAASIVAAGQWVEQLLNRKNDGKATYIAAALGAITLAVIGLIPVFGPLIVIIAFIAGLGAVAKYDWNLIKDLRLNKKL